MMETKEAAVQRVGQQCERHVFAPAAFNWLRCHVSTPKASKSTSNTTKQGYDRALWGIS